ncbi:ABC-type Fe3+-siderophore transport system permease subunit [Trueperella bonasi]|uniref:ABC-type Fe3+-siderophore transport system permease subunit n=2 Tax=Trueperella bonasi TaxID=312286 RepID=A0ABT9NHS6_9ACTO|nr:ABC-type Fe3+-siderophore transport system permease subunit [Trueperella bonasi]
MVLAIIGATLSALFVYAIGSLGRGGATPLKLALAGAATSAAMSSLVAGICFGFAGATFQTLLRNQLASPDIIGISSGAAAAGVVAIVILRLPQSQVSMFALFGSLSVTASIYALSLRKGQFAGTRLILVGIGISAILGSVVTCVLSRAAAWDLGTATRLLNGSLNGTTWDRIWPPMIGAVILLPILAYHLRDLQIIRLSDDAVPFKGELMWETPEEVTACEYFWIAGESEVVRALRRRLVNDDGCDKSQISFMGYWKKS